MALRLKGSKNLRQRLICSTLSGRAIRVEEIRSGDARPGLRDHEVSFLRLLEKMTNGCGIEITETGTSFYYRPGVLCGGRVSHDCHGCGRGVGYFLEAALALAPFGKEPLELTLLGITNDNQDPSADYVRAVLLPNAVRFGLGDGVDLRIVKRGAAPEGGGEVVLTCPSVRALKPIQLDDDGRVRRIRGVAYCTRMSPQTANRMVESARGILNPFARDIYVFTDHRKGPEGGKSPGFSVTLVAETTSGCLIGAELAGDAGDIPEDVGASAARALLAEVERRGCIDSTGQWLTLLFMLLAPEDVSRVRMGKLSQFTVECLRLYKEMFGVVFKVTPDPETKTVVLSCLGTGYSNVAKRIF